MKPTTRLNTLFLLFMVFNMTMTYGQYVQRKAGELKAVFEKMHTTTNMEEWKGTQTCTPETLIKLVKDNASITPETETTKINGPDLETATSNIWRDRIKDPTKEFIVSDQEIKPKDHPCAYIVRSYMREIDAQGKWKTYRIKTTIRVDCECTDDSTNKDIKTGTFIYEAIIRIRVSSNSIKFSYPKDEDLGKVKIIRLECCPGKDDDQDDTPKDDDEETPEEDGEDNDDGDGDDKDDKEDHMANEENEDCCTSEDPKQTIGFVPGFGLTNNFEDFSYDLGIEYLRNIGDSFGDDTLYAGALVGYMGENRQDGEVKETMWYAAGIIQNRSPFSFCDDLQWINQICVLYGEGQIDAFGNTDDFSTFSVGVHTGFNFQFNDKFAVGADVTVASIGSTTFTSENGGSEFKQDIGDLFVNKRNGVRFGFRFTF
nr:hypothetical protein [uncultured Psychroserpens sp.]